MTKNKLHLVVSVVLAMLLILVGLWSPHAFATCSVTYVARTWAGAGQTFYSGTIGGPFLPSGLITFLGGSYCSTCNYVGTVYWDGNCTSNGMTSGLSYGSTYVMYIGAANGCNGGTGKLQYQINYTSGSGSYNSATKDSDCDGLADAVDPHPLSYDPDTDGDGIIDSLDPFPNDVNCPSQGSWYNTGAYLHSSGCSIQTYSDTSGTCGALWTTSCSSSIVADIHNPCPGHVMYFDECLLGGAWKPVIQIYANPKGRSYSALFPSGGGSSNEESGDSAGGGASGASSSGGASGSTVPSSLSTTDNQKIADLLQGIQQVTGVLTKELADWIGPGAGTGTGGFWPQTEVATQTAVKAALDQKDAEAPTMPGVPSVSQGTLDQINDMTGAGVDENVTKLTNEQSGLASWIDSFMVSSGIQGFFSNSGISVEVGDPVARRPSA